MLNYLCFTFLLITKNKNKSVTQMINFVSYCDNNFINNENIINKIIKNELKITNNVLHGNLLGVEQVVEHAVEQVVEHVKQQPLTNNTLQTLLNTLTQIEHLKIQKQNIHLKTTYSNKNTTNQLKNQIIEQNSLLKQQIATIKQNKQSLNRTRKISGIKLKDLKENHLKRVEKLQNIIKNIKK